MNKKFWTWVKELAVRKLKEIYMDEHHWNTKCPNCNTWVSEVDGAEGIVEVKDRQYMLCKKCGFVSKWIDHGIFAEADEVFANLYLSSAADAEAVQKLAELTGVPIITATQKTPEVS